MDKGLTCEVAHLSHSKVACCQVAHKAECPCLFGPGPGRGGKPRVDYLWASYKKVSFLYITLLFLQILNRLSYEPQFNREDFVVEYKVSQGS